MTGGVRVLPPELASRIAAGEVVERPSSAVKELIENAVDAGATRCDVSIAGGGITSIVVRDDGEGMSEPDARLSVERHATSKLRVFDDLSRLESYGFRGEALPSIASVSRLRVQTRRRDDEAGVEVFVEGGAPSVVRAIGRAVGTTVTVSDLFYNVPARRKFLRSSGTESGHVGEVLEGAALARPTLSFTLERDGRKVREWLRAPDREGRVRQLLPEEELTLCRGERGPLAVEAWLTRPERARSGAAGLKLMVNGRPVRERAVATAVAQAYGSVLERGRYPRGVVYLDLPASLLDVNVHPQKSEVRFADARAVTDAVYGIVSRALASAFSLPIPSRASWGRGAAPAVDVRGWRRSERDPVDERERAPASTGAAPRVWPLAESGPRGSAPQENQIPLPTTRSSATEPAAAAAPAPRSVASGADVEARPALGASDAAPLRPGPESSWKSLRFIAQVKQTYLVCEGADGLYVLDQHAAAERVTFHRLRVQLGSKSIASQVLMFPVNLEVTPLEAELCERYGDEIASMGLEVRVRGAESVSVHAVPQLLQRASPERLFRDLLAEVSRSGGRGFSDAVDLALATMACHGSIRAGDPLSPAEASALLAALDQADFAGHCPHGRPVVTFTSWAELERKVGRR